MDMPTTRITIMRGTEADDAGDLSDVGVPLYQHVPAALLQASMQAFDPSSSTRRTVRTIKCLLQPWQEVDVADTILDEGTGNYYAIEDIQQQPSLGYPGDLLLTLRSVTGVSVASGPQNAVAS
jgi:hypothetical protein